MEFHHVHRRVLNPPTRLTHHSRMRRHLHLRAPILLLRYQSQHRRRDRAPCNPTQGGLASKFKSPAKPRTAAKTRARPSKLPRTRPFTHRPAKASSCRLPRPRPATLSFRLAPVDPRIHSLALHSPLQIRPWAETWKPRSRLCRAESWKATCYPRRPIFGAACSAGQIMII